MIYGVNSGQLTEVAYFFLYELYQSSSTYVRHVNAEALGVMLVGINS